MLSLGLVFQLAAQSVSSQSAPTSFGKISIKGTVTDGQKPIPATMVRFFSTEGKFLSGAYTDADGKFNVSLPALKELEVSFAAIGYLPMEKHIHPSDSLLEAGLNIALVEEGLLKDQVVITGSRFPVQRQNSAALVQVIGNREMVAAQSMSLADGLRFSPGLRVENNCQNCGFTSVRMNGLPGPYSQVLLNSRPVFSSLAAVYGLEQLPVSLVDRVEVTRGGGSALYGGNAIAGTINILTKDPIFSGYQVGSQSQLMGGRSLDMLHYGSTSLVNDAGNSGITLLFNKRNRQAFDANDDGFTEIPQLDQQNFHLSAFYKPVKNLRLGAWALAGTEYRRGGSDLNRPPHEAAIAEELNHLNLAGGLTADFELGKSSFSAYTAAQSITRKSYYGSGGRPLTFGDTLNEGDVLALNAYGNTTDLNVNSGLQYRYKYSDALALMTGTEVVVQRVVDNMPGYQRSINQQVITPGAFAQAEWSPLPALNVVAGLRLDNPLLNGIYTYPDNEVVTQQKQFTVLLPRVNVRWAANDWWRFRAGYAEGYRAPQAFDEDLHIESVGGAMRYIRLAPNLQTEKSASYSLSSEWTLADRSNNQQLLTLEFFRTDLRNPFVLAGTNILPNGIVEITKVNGAAAMVQGFTTEWRSTFSGGLSAQAGFSAQQTLYSNPNVLWEEEDEPNNQVAVSRFIRTPDFYGFLQVQKDFGFFRLMGSYVLTGPMLVPHITDPESQKPVLKTSSPFHEISLKVAKDFKLTQETKLQVFAGVQNLLNSYQNDFDRGPLRDSQYIYGPMLPRTFSIGIKLGRGEM